MKLTDLKKSFINKYPESKGILYADFSGSGDNGAIDAVYYIAADEPFDIDFDAAESYFYEALEKNYPGWEINDGAQGTMTFDMNSGTIKINIGHNYTSTEEFELVYNAPSDVRY